MEKEYHKLTIKPITLTVSHREQPSQSTISFILGTYKKGDPGLTPYIGENGNWFIGVTDTGVKAAGTDGTNGTDGADGRGITSIIKTSTVGLVDTYTITYSDSTTSTFDVTNGANAEINHDATLTGSGTSGDPLGVTSNLYQLKNLKFTDTAASTWLADTTYTTYLYRCELTLSGVTAADIAEVIFAHSQAISGNYSPISLTATNKVTIYSKVNTAITIPTIIISKN